MTANKTTTYAVIKVIVYDKEYKSIPLDISNDEDNERLVQILSEQGTSHLSMFKMPTSETSFIIFSREQLNSALFEIKLMEKITRIKPINIKENIIDDNIDTNLESN